MIALGLRSRRRIRRHGLQALRGARRHYFSLLSAAILAVALVLALTSASLEVRSNVRPQSAGAAFTPWATATPGIMPVQSTPSPASPVVIYYMFDSDQERYEMQATIQSEAMYQARHGIQPAGMTFREFIVVKNVDEEAAAFQFLNDLIKLSNLENFSFHFVDLR